MLAPLQTTFLPKLRVWPTEKKNEFNIEINKSNIINQWVWSRACAGKCKNERERGRENYKWNYTLKSCLVLFLIIIILFRFIIIIFNIISLRIYKIFFRFWKISYWSNLFFFLFFFKEMEFSSSVNMWNDEECEQ